MSGMTVGLSVRLMMDLARRIGFFEGIGQMTQVDASYCLDATEAIPAGSTERYEFGPNADDWVAVETFCERSKP